jgi:hypothetical protein
LTSAIQAEKLSWKTTTKFMERPGSLGYIFVKSGWNAIAKLTVVIMEPSFGGWIFLITIEKV